MKNKLLVCAFAVAIGASLFTSCREKTDFDAICDSISKESLNGMFSGAALFGDSLIVSEYLFQKDGSVEFSELIMGDGFFKAPVKTKFTSWELGDYNNQNLGRYVILHPENGDAPKTVNFIRAMIEEQGKPYMADKNDKVVELPKLQESIIGKKWHGLDTTFFKVDTVINLMQIDSTVYKHKEGKKYVIDSVIYDTTYIPTKMKWAVGPSQIAERRIELNRDSNTLVNTGKWYLMRKEYSYDKNRVQTQTLDTVSSYDFHWTFSEYNSVSSFSIIATYGENDAEYFEFKYDSKLPALTLNKQLLYVETEE